MQGAETMKCVLLMVAAALLGGCVDQQATYVAPAPGRAPVQRAPYDPATLILTNFMNVNVTVLFDGVQRCTLGTLGTCLVDDIAPGNHTLRVVQPSGTFWQSPYVYSEDETVTCSANADNVKCNSDGGSLF